MSRQMRGSWSQSLSVSAVHLLRMVVYGVAVIGLLAAMVPAHAQDEFGMKNLQGKVLDAHNAPISGAIVYLRNSRNNDVKSFLSTSNGSYRFANLSADTDYTVWAAYHGKKSSTKEVSSFDTRKQVYIDLQIK